jgi:hypothetical protein
VTIDSGLTPLLDLTIARVSDTSIVVCYRVNSTVLRSGMCRAGSVTPSGISFGSACRPLRAAGWHLWPACCVCVLCLCVPRGCVVGWMQGVCLLSSHRRPLVHPVLLPLPAPSPVRPAGNITVTDSLDYTIGRLTGVFGDTDRVVLAFSAGSSSKLLVIGVSGLTLTPLTSGTNLEIFENAPTDSISFVSLTRLIFLLSYRVRCRPIRNPFRLWGE